MRNEKELCIVGYLADVFSVSQLLCPTFLLFDFVATNFCVCLLKKVSYYCNVCTTGERYKHSSTVPEKDKLCEDCFAYVARMLQRYVKIKVNENAINAQ